MADARLEKIVFKNRRGFQIHGRLHIPAGFTRAYALYAHCFTCTKDIKAARNICQYLSERGIAALRIDFTGLGESEGDFNETTFTTNVEDLIDAAEFLKEHYHPPEILIGHSLGGTAALVAASKIPEIKAVSTINAPWNPGHVARHLQDSQEKIMLAGHADVSISGRKFTIEKRFFDDLLTYDMEAVFRNLKAALLVFHAPHDDTVNIKNASEIFALAKHPKSFISLDSADHLIMNRDDASYIAASIAAWASRYISFDLQEEAAPVDRKQQVVVTETDEGLLTQRVYAGRHVLRADEPTSVSGGLDLGPNPYDYLMAALGSCTSMTIRMYAQYKKIPIERISVYLDHKQIHADDCKDSKGKTGKIDAIERIINIEGDLTKEQLDRVLQIADKCPVHKTLQGGVVVNTTLDKGKQT